MKDDTSRDRVILSSFGDVRVVRFETPGHKIDRLPGEKIIKVETTSKSERVVEIGKTLRDATESG